ncbi:MAG: hypothetical protein ACJ8HQ_12875, partial [Chthoniobacterales bacterium]
MATEVKRVRRRRRHSQRHTGSRSRIGIYAAAALVGLALGWMFSTYAPRAYTSWRESRLLKRASVMMQNGDFSSATLAAQQMLQIHPDSL